HARKHARLRGDAELERRHRRAVLGLEHARRRLCDVRFPRQRVAADDAARALQHRAFRNFPAVGLSLGRYDAITGFGGRGGPAADGLARLLYRRAWRRRAQPRRLVGSVRRDDERRAGERSRLRRHHPRHRTLGGGQAGLNWQTGHWVYGLQADWSAADLRGENTCFSGLGGLNCQHVIRSIATGAARIGYAWDRALVYAKGGGAETKIDYILQGNTSGISRGYEVTGVRAWGWTAGGGLEYALTDHWTTMCEFDHIDLGNISVPFPNVLR